MRAGVATSLTQVNLYVYDQCKIGDLDRSAEILSDARPVVILPGDTISVTNTTKKAVMVRVPSLLAQEHPRGTVLNIKERSRISFVVGETKGEYELEVSCGSKFDDPSGPNIVVGDPP
ncbi:MAG: hypothetical protein R3B81_09095 [bacterium]